MENLVWLQRSSAALATTLPNPTDNRRLAVDRTYHKHILGFRAGAGLEVTVNRVMGIRGDWTVDYYPKVEIKGTKQSDTKEKQSIVDNRFGIGLTIYLSDACLPWVLAQPSKSLIKAFMKKLYSFSYGHFEGLFFSITRIPSAIVDSRS